MTMAYFLITVFFVSVATATGLADLEGTWSTKSREVVTGPVRLVLSCALIVKTACRSL